MLDTDHRRYGLPRLIVLLRRDGFEDNHKRIGRIYRAANLQVRNRVKRKLALGRGRVDAPAQAPNDSRRFAVTRRRPRSASPTTGTGPTRASGGKRPRSSRDRSRHLQTTSLSTYPRWHNRDTVKSARPSRAPLPSKPKSPTDAGLFVVKRGELLLRTQCPGFMNARERFSPDSPDELGAKTS